MAAVYTSNLTINAGATFNQTFELENSDSSSPLDLTGYTLSSKMKKHGHKWSASLRGSVGVTTFNYQSTGITTFTSSIVSAINGQIKIGLSSITTAEIIPGRYQYDVLVTDGVGMVTRVIEGSVLVREGVSA